MSKLEHIGILGGTFDPVHIVHIELAYLALHYAQLNKVIFIPAGLPPHKKSNVFASAEDRFNMLILATRKEPRFEVSKVEINRTGPSYTFHTLNYFHEHYPHWELNLIVGEDTLLDIPNWYLSDKVIEMVTHFLVAKRPNCNIKRIPDALLQKTIWLPSQQKDIASHEIRKLIQENKPITQLVPPEVETYIHEKRLYRN